MSEFPKTVKTTINPDKEISVDEAEYTDLKRMGILIEKPVTPAPAKDEN
jgi:hypothetical protein